MKKDDKKAKPKPKTKTKAKTKKSSLMKQKQSQNVVINISNGKSKTKSAPAKSVKPNYLQTITTYPIFREAPQQEPLYKNPETQVHNPLGFIDKTSINTQTQTDVPLVQNKNSSESLDFMATPKNYGSSKKEISKEMDYIDSAETPKKPQKGRPRLPPLSAREMELKRQEVNRKRILAYHEKINREKKENEGGAK